MPVLGVATDGQDKVSKPQPPKPVSLVRGNDGFIAFPLAEYEIYQNQLLIYLQFLEGKSDDSER
jgi:hypothetical protein